MTNTISYKTEDIKWRREYAVYNSFEEEWLHYLGSGIVPLNSNSIWIDETIAHILYKTYCSENDNTVYFKCGHLHLVPIDIPQLPYNNNNSCDINFFELWGREPDWANAIQLPVLDDDFMYGAVDEFVQNLPLGL